MIWDFIKNHYKLILLILLPIGAFAGGRYSAPTTYKDHEVYSEQAVSSEVEKRVAAYKQEYEKKLKVDLTETVIKEPGGKVVIQRHKTVQSNETKVETKIQYVDREVIKKVTETVTIDKEITRDTGRWFASIKVGVDSLNFTNPLIGVEVDHRLLGPIYVGGWGMAKTNFSEVQVGLALGVKF